MKHIKMLGLAAVAAALMALAGAGTASAAPVICSTTVDPCPAAQMWPNGTALDFSSENSTGTGPGKVVFDDTSGFVKNECESTIKGTLTNNPTGAPTISGITLTWTNCVRLTANITIGTLSVDTITGSSNGTVTVDTEFEVTTRVPSIFGGEISCVFRLPPGLDLGILKEGNPPTLEINTVDSLTAGQPPECPSSTRLTAKYKLTSPSGTTGSLSHN